MCENIQTFLCDGIKGQSQDCISLENSSRCKALLLEKKKKLRLKKISGGLRSKEEMRIDMSSKLVVYVTQW